MTGWLILIALAASLFAGLWWVIRPTRAVMELIGAALLLAAAGYAWQGNPGLPGKPTGPKDARPAPSTSFAEERGDWLEKVGPDAQVLDTADGLIRNGDADYATGIVRGALAKRPKSPMLWIGLGNALVHYADGVVTPPARFAFERASALWPRSPAPAYFLGLAYAESGDMQNALGLWRGVLAASPPQARWRARVTDQIARAEAAAAMSPGS